MTFRRALATVLVLLASVACALFIAVWATGWSIDATRWSGLVSRQASSALGRPVELSGTLRVTLGREVGLSIGRVRVLADEGPSSPQMLSVDNARLTIAAADVPGLLRSKLRLSRVEAGEITLTLAGAANGPGSKPSPTQRAPSDDTAQDSGAALQIKQLVVNRLVIHRPNAGHAQRDPWVFESLAGSIGADSGVQLRGVGQIDGWPVLRFSVDAGPLQHLAGGVEPWPFALTLRADGATMLARGSFNRQASRLSAELDASVDEPERLGRRFGLALPPLGRVGLRATLNADANEVVLTAHQARVPGAQIEGRLAWSSVDRRPRLSGALSIAELDVGPSLDALSKRPAEPAGDDRADWRSLRWPTHWPFDVDVQLSVAQTTGLPLDIRDVKLHWQADDQGLRWPVEASLSGARARALLHIDTSTTNTAVSLALDLQDVPADRWSRELSGGDGIAVPAGPLGQASLRAQGTGDTLGSWVRQLDSKLALSGIDANVSVAGLDRTLQIKLDRLDLQTSPGAPVRGNAKATVNGERVSVGLQAGGIRQLLDAHSWPVDVQLASATARGRVRADPLAWASGDDAALAFELQAGRAADVARWLGLAAGPALPVALSGQLTRGADAWQVGTATLKLGRSDLTLDARVPRGPTRGVTTARLRSSRLDVPELATLRRPPRDMTPGTGGGFALPAPLANLDLSINLQTLALGTGEISDLGLSANVRHGVLASSPLHATVAGTRFDGMVEFDPHSAPMSGQLEVASGPVDIDQILRELGIDGDAVDGRADALRLRLRSQGRDAAELAARVEARASWSGGSVAYVAPGRRALIQAQVQEAEVVLAPGEPVRARVVGSIGDEPMDIDLRFATLAQLREQRDALPFSLTAFAAGTEFGLDGQVALPLSQKGSLRLRLRGDRLDSLNTLTGAELPAWGPWSVESQIHLAPGGFELPGLQLQVGQSTLSAQASLDLSGTRPMLTVQALAPVIDLNDFVSSARLSTPTTRPIPWATAAVRRPNQPSNRRVEPLSSPAFLRRFDADVDLRVEQLRAGTDGAVDLSARLRLNGGQLELDPVVAKLPGGAVRLSMLYSPKASDIDFTLKAAVDRFDYGVVARQLGRGQHVQGLVSVDVNLQSRAPSLATLPQHANGHVDFAIWPTEMRSGVFNFWSVNMLLTLVPLIDEDPDSRVNCVVSHADMRDGVLRTDRLVIDTRSVRIEGHGEANLRTEALDFVFRPRAKGVAIFRLQTPLRVSGTLFDQRFGLKPWDLPLSVLRLVASPVLWPIEQVTLGRLPTGGADLCTDPMRSLSP